MLIRIGIFDREGQEITAWDQTVNIIPEIEDEIGFRIKTRQGVAVIKTRTWVAEHKRKPPKLLIYAEVLRYSHF